MGKGQELLDAAREGDKRAVEKILGQITKRSGPFTSLRRGAGVNVQDDNGYTPLHHACLRGHRDIVRLLLAADASPCVVDKKGATPLHLAAWKGDSDVVGMLLVHNNPPVNIDQLTAERESALLIAAQFGYVDVVAQLLAHGADVALRNIKDESALDLAAQYGRLETVQHLLRARPQLVDPYKYPICRGRLFSSTPLHRASKNGHKEVVSTLISAGIEPNIRTYSGTPLHDAACFGKASVVRILLAKGADLNAVDRRGKTVHDLLADYSEEATRRVRRAIREYENSIRNNMYESEEDLPPFPSQDYSPTGYPNSTAMKPTQTPSKSSLSYLTPPTKHCPQSFVKKLASKCLSFKAKFNSAPNISNAQPPISDVNVKNKQLDQKNSIHVGNSKFFKLRSKKAESGDVVCNDEFDTISLDRVGTLNRDSVVNRSNRSCPGFKTSLPNISENMEMNDSNDLISEPIVSELSLVANDINSSEESSHNKVFEEDLIDFRDTVKDCINNSISGNTLVNECYESYELPANIPDPPPRPNVIVSKIVKDVIYENITLNKDKNIVSPTPATRINVPKKEHNASAPKVAYENIKIIPENIRKSLSEKGITIDIEKLNTNGLDDSCKSSSSSIDTDSLTDEANLEDIFLSEKSKSFRRSRIINNTTDAKNNTKNSVHRTQSNVSSFSNTTGWSEIENVNCSDDEDDKNKNLTGTLPNSKGNKTNKRLFRHKTFTNIEADKKLTKVEEATWNNNLLRDNLANFHIKGTGHCIYSTPTVKEFIQMFNQKNFDYDDTLSNIKSEKRDSYFETAICFCKPAPSKQHNSAEDLIDLSFQEDGKVLMDVEALKNKRELLSTTFQCFCDSSLCRLHEKIRKSSKHLAVKFSVVKKSISTPDVTIDSISTVIHQNLTKNVSVPYNLDKSTSCNDSSEQTKNNDLGDTKKHLTGFQIHTIRSQTSTTSSNEPYSLKDISEVVSVNNGSMSSSNNSTTSTICTSNNTNFTTATNLPPIPVRKSSSSEHSGHWSLHTCNSNVTIKSDGSFQTCLEESSDDDDTLHSDDDSETDTVKSETAKRPWVHSDSFKFNKDVALEIVKNEASDTDDGSVSRLDKLELGVASLEPGLDGAGDCSGRRRWEDAEGTSEGDALSVSSAASSCAAHHMLHNLDYSKISPTPPKKPPRRNLSVSPTHANSPSSGYGYGLRAHARSQDELDDIQGPKPYLRHGRSVDQYTDGKLSCVGFDDAPPPRAAPVPNPRPSLKTRAQPVAITAMYENVVIKEQNPRRKLKRNNNLLSCEGGVKYAAMDKSSLESLLDSTNSPSDCYSDSARGDIPSSPTHYNQPPTPDHPPPSARHAENSIHERIRPLSQLIMEVVEEIRIRKKSQAELT